MLPLSPLQFAMLVTLPLATTKKTVRKGGLINNAIFPEHNPIGRANHFVGDCQFL